MRIKDRPEFNRKAAMLTYGPDELVITAVRSMSELNYGAVVVVSPDNKPVGIVTERDFMRRLLNNALDPSTTKLRDIMTTDLKIAHADDDLLDWLRQMSNDRFRHLPVVNEDGVIINIMSQGDFVSYTWPQLIERLKEQTRATLDINPSIFAAIGGGIVFMLIIILAVAIFK
jgi:signal-transduction protein with cAMP-binding, CBS, and nucleotidyltransferase domain